MKRTYPKGETVLISATFLDPTSNKQVNPSSVLLRLRDPSNVEIRPAVSNPDVGVFYASIVPTSAGVWHARWEGRGLPGNNLVAIENSFDVAPSAFT